MARKIDCRIKKNKSTNVCLKGRIGNPRFKKVKGFRSSKSGIVDTEKFILNRKPFNFVHNGQKSTVFAPTRKEAVKVHKLHLKQEPFISKSGNIVVFARSQKEANRKIATERRARIKINKANKKAGKIFRVLV